ncbi:hypothetical protein LEM8419_00724 [Neolewinella maritima]|uniref:Acyl-CoA dehydrogenase n=1 Tax=Neolewinella maritima TaxID=1383882 RepID=A0ABN8F0H4_9BACT|nr:acyl-CoA dehydrogenase family protein [Neolewinella maritima]CAH0999425.1 hypothetical protein LEM8419_00724 [Neolewinella maritima]
MATSFPSNSHLSRDPSTEFISIEQLRRQFTEWSASTRHSQAFPHREMDALRQAGYLGVTLPGAPLDQRKASTAGLLRLLYQIGQGSLSVGRIYEGHINALYLIGVFGTPAQQERWYADARAGHLFGVWNTQMGDGIHFHPTATDDLRIQGSKSFCSGSVQVTRPIVPGVLHDHNGKELGWQMSVVALDRHSPPVDASFWTPVGMQNSVSHKIDFSDIVIARDELLGAPEDYNSQPHLSGGAIRFAAVHLGGGAAVYEATRTALRQAGRTADPYQRTRLAKMAIRLESGRHWLDRAGHVNDHSTDPREIVNYANMVRTAIADYCSEILQLAEVSVGVRGMLHPHPLARLHGDLTTYLRQPAPDATLESVGQYYFNDAPSD